MFVAWFVALPVVAAAPVQIFYTGSDPYLYHNRSSAAAVCTSTAGRFPRLCDKAELEGYSLCAVLVFEQYFALEACF
jgi:hypothetical protein